MNPWQQQYDAVRTVLLRLNDGRVPYMSEAKLDELARAVVEVLRVRGHLKLDNEG